MNGKKPKITIITINFNNRAGLEETIKSVVDQSYLNLEYIVIDGGSNDGSEDVISKASNHLTYWISEKDNGIYHAMNKGIEKATGEYFLFLNSGDRLINNQIIDQVVSEELTHDLVYGNLLFFDQQKEWIWNLPSTLTFYDFYTSTIAHPSTFIKRTLFEKIGKYDEQLKIVSDWKFFLVAFGKFNCSYKHINHVISAYRFDGISSKPENLEAINAERNKVLNREFPFFIADYQELITLKKEAKQLKRFIRFGRAVNKILNKK